MTLRSLPSRATRALRLIDRKMARPSARRIVLVEARTPMNLAVLRPVLDRVREDPRITVRFTGRPRADLRKAFAELHVLDGVLSRRRASWSRVDLYINADPWDAVPLHRTAKQLNFFHGVAGKYNLDCPESLPLGFGRYDRVAFPNRGRLERYVEAGIVRREQAALVGYPKIDALVRTPVRPRDAAAALGLDPSRATVIYAPTFSPASSLSLAGEAIVEALLTSGCNVIAKLHDRSLDPDPKYTSGIDWRQRLSRFSRARRTFLLAESGDSTAYVQASDLMVTDHSSIGFEFCALDRPLIVYEAPGLVQAARINPEKVSLLRSAAIVVDSVAALRPAVAEALDAPLAKSAERAHAAADVFYAPGTATDRALALVYELLELAPAAEPAVARHAGAWSCAR